MWTMKAGWLIMDSARKTLKDISTAGDCKRLCTEETQFECVAVNYQSRAASKICELLSVNKAGAGDKLKESSAADGYDYYESEIVDGE